MSQQSQKEKTEEKKKIEGNLDFWNRVNKTDPEFTKLLTFGRRQTAIDPHYQRYRATREWGKFGEGWGVENQKISMHPEIGETGLCIYEAEMWYMSHGKKCSFAIASSAELLLKDKQGKIKGPDSDCVKKANTDAVKKGLSFLGFSADVYFGKYDDDKYVASLRAEKRQMQAEKQNGQQAESAPVPKNVVPIKQVPKLEPTFDAYIKAIRGSIQDNVFNAVLKRFGAKKPEDVVKQDQKAFYQVLLSYTKDDDKDYFIGAITKDLRKTSDTRNPDLYRKVMEQYGITMGTASSAATDKKLLKDLNAFKIEHLAEMYRTMLIGLRSVSNPEETKGAVK